MMTYEQFNDQLKNQAKTLNTEQEGLKKKLKDVRVKKLKVRMDQYNKKRQEIAKRMSKYVAGPSSYQ